VVKIIAMGPLVPFVFSEEFGLLLAVFIGFGFGFVLEQAGFSSTKKLVGLFYGYDFTVLRVFFTAGVTAMVGVLLLGHYGLLELEMIYINPTFTRSAIVGGLVMGGGFIIGGFCPGTSVCAAAIGKIDAMIFVLGSIFGVFAFAESYPLIKGFYEADAMGAVKISDLLGMSDIVFGFTLAAVAFAAFYFTWRIENSVNGRTNSIDPIMSKYYLSGIGVTFVLLLIVALLPGKDDIIQARITKAKEQKKCVFHEISADKLASDLTSNYYSINLIDVRSPEEFEKYHLPLAINIPLNEITNREWSDVFNQKIKTNIFYSDVDTITKMACLKARFVGKSENIILRESAQQFKQMFFELSEPDATASKQEVKEYHFRSEAARKLNELVETLQNNKPVKKVIKSVKGGCS
jgi:rhodanese-related sulfurtransferase